MIADLAHLRRLAELAGADGWVKLTCREVTDFVDCLERTHADMERQAARAVALTELEHDALIRFYERLEADDGWDGPEVEARQMCAILRKVLDVTKPGPAIVIDVDPEQARISVAIDIQQLRAKYGEMAARVAELERAAPIAPGKRCPRCHYVAPNIINGCARCNPERFGERVAESLEENTKLREQVKDLEDRLAEIRSKV